MTKLKILLTIGCFTFSTLVFAGNPIFGPMIPDIMTKDVEAFLEAEKKLTTNGHFDAKTVQLMGLAASVGMKCEYCIIAHTGFARKQGATDQEIKQAILIANYVAFKSSMLYGNQFDIEKLKKMFK